MWGVEDVRGRTVHRRARTWKCLEIPADAKLETGENAESSILSCPGQGSTQSLPPSRNLHVVVQSEGELTWRGFAQENSVSWCGFGTSLPKPRGRGREQAAQVGRWGSGVWLSQ